MYLKRCNLLCLSGITWGLHTQVPSSRSVVKHVICDYARDCNHHSTLKQVTRDACSGKERLVHDIVDDLTLCSSRETISSTAPIAPSLSYAERSPLEYSKQRTHLVKTNRWQCSLLSALLSNIAFPLHESFLHQINPPTIEAWSLEHTTSVCFWLI